MSAVTNGTLCATWADVMQSEYIDPMIGDYFLDASVVVPAMRMIDLRGKQTLTATVNTWASDIGDVEDAGGESDDFTASALTPNADVNILTKKVGILRQPSVELLQTMGDMEVRNEMARDAGRLLANYVEDAACGLFTSATSNVTHTTIDFSVAYFLEVLATIRALNAPGPYTMVLHPVQASDLQVSAASSAGALMGNSAAGAQNIFGFNQGGYVGNLFGVNIYSSSLVDKVAGDADYIGACFVDARVDKGGAALAIALTWDPTSMVADAPENGTVKLLFHLGYGVGLVRADAITKIITDA